MRALTAQTTPVAPPVAATIGIATVMLRSAMTDAIFATAIGSGASGRSPGSACHASYVPTCACPTLSGAPPLPWHARVTALPAVTPSIAGGLTVAVALVVAVARAGEPL